MRTKTLWALPWLLAAIGCGSPNNGPPDGDVLMDGGDGGDGGDGDGGDGDGGDEDGGDGDGGDGCDQPCTAEGASHCTIGGTLTCERLPAGCLSWVPRSCPPGETCSKVGASVACGTTCDDDCNPATGWGRCADGLHLSCEEADADPCNDFVVDDVCAPGVRCFDSAGCAECLDGCTMEGYRSCGSDTRNVTECGDFDSDSCLEWRTRDCADDEACDPIVLDCVCRDMCPSMGLLGCEGFYAAMSCADHDGDGCLEWGGRTDCGMDETCEGGVCSTSCTNGCRTVGSHLCYSGARYRTCGDWDTDPCREWTASTPCPAGLICHAGSALAVPCVECIDSLDCRPRLELCVANSCAPPPGECFETSDPALPSTVGTGLMSTTTVTRAGTVGSVSVFLGLGGLLSGTAADLDIRLRSPAGTVAFLTPLCAPLPAADEYWGLLDSSDAPELSRFAGETAAGDWTLQIIPCSGDGSASLQTWAVCFGP